MNLTQKCKKSDIGSKSLHVIDMNVEHTKYNEMGNSESDIDADSEYEKSLN